MTFEGLERKSEKILINKIIGSGHRDLLERRVQKSSYKTPVFLQLMVQVLSRTTLDEHAILQYFSRLSLMGPAFLLLTVVAVVLFVSNLSFNLWNISFILTN